MSALERLTVQRLVDRAEQLGLVPQVPQPLRDFLCGDGPAYGGGLLWARAHPDDTTWRGCCWGEAMNGPEHCTCWRPVFDVEQVPPRLPVGAADIQARDGLCGDCAYRKGSPERADAWMEEALLELPTSGQPFFCHDGMRRPLQWEHPDGRTVAGAPEDWQPPRVAGIPFRTDGRPGLLCGGWAARAARDHDLVQVDASEQGV